MLRNQSKEMTFSPYNSENKKQDGAQQSRSESPQLEEDQDQLNPDDLFMDYSYQQMKNQKNIDGRYNSQKLINNYQLDNEFSQWQPNLMNCQRVQLNLDDKDQDSYQNNQCSFMGNYNNEITPQQFLVNNNEGDSNENNLIGQSQSYILNSSQFVNNNISSILGNNCSQANNNSSNISCSLFQGNSFQNQQNYINVYEDQKNQQMLEIHNQNQFCVYQSEQNNLNNFQNGFVKQSLREQISQRLSSNNNNNNEQDINFYKYNQNQNSKSNNEYIKDIDNQIKQSNNQGTKSIQSYAHQRSQSNGDLFNNKNYSTFQRRNSINDSSSISSQNQNLSYHSLYAPRQTQGLKQNKQNTEQDNTFNNESKINEIISNNQNQIQDQSNQQQINVKKQLLFNMIVETPDAHQEVINVFEGVPLFSLAEDFCIKNNMDISKYCEFIKNRLQIALNHYNSFQSPKKKQKESVQPQNQIFNKYVNSQESAVFQITEQGITPANNKNINIKQYCSNRPQLIVNNNNNSYLLDQQNNKIDDSVKTSCVNGSPQEQVFELPYKSLIYELNLSNLPDEICYNDYDEQGNKQVLISHSNNSFEQKNEQNTNYVMQDPNAISSVTITLNPIENITQKISEQLNVNNIFEEQIQSNCQSIEQLKQNIQKSLEKQHNIQQEFHRRYNSHTQQYESNRNYNSNDKINNQKSSNQEYQSPIIQLIPTPTPVELSNHFNRYDILKYQESQESSRQSKQPQSNQKIDNDRNQSIKKAEQINQSDKLSVKIISPLKEEKYNHVSEFMKNNQYLSLNQQNLKMQAKFTGNNNSFYSPTSTNSFEQHEQALSQNKSNCAQFFGSNRSENKVNQYDFMSQKQDLKNQLLQAQIKINNQDIKEQKQNMSSLASQIDDYKNGDMGSLKSEIDKQGTTCQDMYKQQQQQTKYLFNHSVRQNSSMLEGIMNFSSIQKEKLISDSESLRIFDEKQQEIIPGCYKVCQSRIEFEEVSRENINQQTQNPNYPQNRKDINLQNANQNQSNDHQSVQSNLQNIYNSQYSSINNHFQKIHYDSYSDQSNNNLNNNNYQINSNIDKSQFQSNSLIQNNQLNEIPNQLIQSDQNKHNSQVKLQNNSIFRNDKQIDQYSSSNTKHAKYQLPPLSSNSKGNSYSNGGMSARSTNRNSSCYSSVNQNLSSVKRSLFSIQNSQRSLNQSSIQQQNLNQKQYQNENQSNQQSNISTARGSISYQQKEYDSIPMSYRTPSSKNLNQQEQKQSFQQNNQNENQNNNHNSILTARGSFSSQSQEYNQIPLSYKTPNSKPQQQQQQQIRQKIEKSENFDQIKQSIFNSIMKSNPSQIMNDVKQIKLNLSPFLEQNKLNEQLQGPLNELYNQHQIKQQQSMNKMKVPTMQSQYYNIKPRNSSISNLRPSNNIINQNDNNKSIHNLSKNDKRSSSTNLGRHSACKFSKMDSNILKKAKDVPDNIKSIGSNENIVSYNFSDTPLMSDNKLNSNQNFKQRVFEIFKALDNDCDGLISADKIEMKKINDLVLFIITPILIEIFTIRRNVNIEEFSCAFLKLFFNLPQQQQEIIIDRNVEICWNDDSCQSFQNLEFFNFNSPLYQQYIDKRNTMQLVSNKTYNWMLDLTNKEFLEFYMSNFKSLVKETNKYIS